MGLSIEGPLRDHPAARPFAEEVLRIHQRYAREVVAAYQLCPFVRKDQEALESAFGDFVVLLDPSLDIELALAAAARAQRDVVHLVYPCVRVPARDFEKFAGLVGKALAETRLHSPVLAAFHPELS